MIIEQQFSDITINRASMKLSIGTANFGLPYGQDHNFEKISTNEIKAILNLAKLHGMNSLDTAIAYGDGEKILGSIGVGDWKITSKVPSIPEKTKHIKALVISLIKESLMNLKVPFLETILVHHPSDFSHRGGKEIISGLVQSKNDGLVKKIGVSVYDTDELESSMVFFKPDVVQCPFSILDNRFNKNNYLAKLNQKRIEVQIRSIFLQGVLAAPVNFQPSIFKKWPIIWAHWQTWLMANNISPVEASTRFAINLANVSQVIVGINKADHLKQIIDYSQKPLLKELPQWPKNSF